MSASRRLDIVSQHLVAAPASAKAKRVAVVIGASKGIGKGCALALAKDGFVVYITGRSVSATNADEITAAAVEEGICLTACC